MPANLIPGVGQRTWVGFGKETTWATAVAPTLFYACESFTPSDKEAYIDRPGPRGIAGRTLAAQGPISVSIAAKFEPDPDVVGQLITFAMGTQSTPSHPSTGTSIAYTSNLTFGAAVKQLQSFTCEYFEDVKCVDYLGCVIDTLKFSGAPGQKLGLDATIVAQQGVVQASPATPTFSTLFPLQAEATGSTTTYASTGIGVAGQVTVKSWDITLNNQVDKSWRTYGNQYVQGFPLGMRKVNATLKLGFESATQYTDYLAQSTITLQFVAASVSNADTATYPYLVTMNLPKCRIVGYSMPQKTSGGLEQTINYECYRDTGGGNDDLYIQLQNTASAVY